MNAVDNHIFDLLSGKTSAIRLATEAASTILKVDQVSEFSSNSGTIGSTAEKANP